MLQADEIRFPEGFLWGAATSSYQIEGAVDVDGRGPSIWDALCRVEGAIEGGESGDLAVDHYHRYREDVALMASLGLRAYRFSIAWPRIQAAGHGPGNEAGLGFYGRLVDELLEAGIEPVATLYHWDLPQALQDAGGWAERETALRFADYAAIVFERLRDRVVRWATLNEPWCSSLLGYAAGVHAPGIRDDGQAIAAIHHLLLAHGFAVGAMRAIDPHNELGIVLNLAPIRGRPAGADLAEAGADLAEPIRRLDGLRNRVWTEPILRARYPADVSRDLGGFGGLPVQAGDLEVIAARLDWLGINYYHDLTLEHAPGSVMADSPGLAGVRLAPPSSGATDMGWPITAAGLTDLLVELSATYPDLPPLYITENGAAYDDPVTDDGIHDARRISYLDAHLRAAYEALVAGVDLRGYFTWSLLDNFEWSFGYAKRFGLVHVDFDSQLRTPRDSALWYRDVIARNGLAAAQASSRGGHD